MYVLTLSHSFPQIYLGQDHPRHLRPLHNPVGLLDVTFQPLRARLYCFFWYGQGHSYFAVGYSSLSEEQGLGCNRAKVVIQLHCRVTTHPFSLARNGGHSPRGCLLVRLNASFFCVCELILTVINHHQTSPEPLNVLLAFPVIVLNHSK